MNYYEHHIKDYDAATAHLTWDEDMAYTRMIRWYYRKEKPIPAELAEACRQMRATSKPQREAVESVLREFFVLRDDGWHKDDCDTALAKFHAGEPEREAKRTNEETRLSRHRAERAALFAIINAAGHHLPYNTHIAEVRALADRINGKAPETSQATNPATPETPATQPATAPATPATATHSPVPTPQPPIPNPQSGIQGEPPAAPTAPPPPRKRGERFVPEGFEVTAEMVQWAAENAPRVDLMRETTMFREWEFSRPKTDWHKTWRTWMLKAESEVVGGRRAGSRADPVGSKHSGFESKNYREGVEADGTFN